MLVLGDFDRQALKEEIVLTRKMKTVPVPRSLSYDEKARRKKNNLHVKTMYTAKRIPCRVGEVVIDFAIYQQYMKKLKGFSVKISATDDGVVLNYSKLNLKGRLELLDMSLHFNHFESLPIAEISEQEV